MKIINRLKRAYEAFVGTYEIMESCSDIGLTEGEREMMESYSNAELAKGLTGECSTWAVMFLKGLKLGHATILGEFEGPKSMAYVNHECRRLENKKYQKALKDSIRKEVVGDVFNVYGKKLRKKLTNDFVDVCFSGYRRAHNLAREGHFGDIKKLAYELKLRYVACPKCPYFKEDGIDVTGANEINVLGEIIWK